MNGADTIIFPELSITGYEPKPSKELAINQDDSRFDDFQMIADTKQITIGVGILTKHNTGVCISMLLFQPHKAKQTHSKKYLHSDEEFFISEQKYDNLIGKKSYTALVTRYELSVP